MKIKRKVCCLIVVALLVTLIAPAMSYAAGAEKVYIEVDRYERPDTSQTGVLSPVITSLANGSYISVGDMVRVGVSVENISLYAIDMTFRFDPGVLQLVTKNAPSGGGSDVVVSGNKPNNLINDGFDIYSHYDNSGNMDSFDATLNTATVNNEEGFVRVFLRRSGVGNINQDITSKTPLVYFYFKAIADGVPNLNFGTEGFSYSKYVPSGYTHVLNPFAVTGGDIVTASFIVGTSPVPTNAPTATTPPPGGTSAPATTPPASTAGTGTGGGSGGTTATGSPAPTGTVAPSPTSPTTADNPYGGSEQATAIIDKKEELATGENNYIIDSGTLEGLIPAAKENGNNKIIVKFAAFEAKNNLLDWITIPAASLRHVMEQDISTVYFELPNLTIAVSPYGIIQNTDENAQIVQIGLGKVNVGAGIGSAYGDSSGLAYRIEVYSDGRKINKFGDYYHKILLPMSAVDASRTHYLYFVGKYESDDSANIISQSRYETHRGMFTFIIPETGTYYGYYGVTPFDDLVEWARPSVEGLAIRGIVNGITPSGFYPDNNVTRGQFVKMIVSAMGFDTSISDSGTLLVDVESGTWYYPYVVTAEKLGIATGYDDDTFRENNNITRQEMAAIAYRAFSLTGSSLVYVNEAAMFDDQDRIAAYAMNPVFEMQKAGVINGMGHNMFEPEGLATRAQAANIIYKLYGLLK